MEPKYERMYGASTGIALLKLFNFERKKSGTPMEKFASMLLTPVFDLVPLADDTQRVVSSNKCGSPGITKFIENLHTFVSSSWKPKNVTDYEFTENDFTDYTIRNYKNAPPTFSPKFWIPTNKRLDVYLNAVEPITEGGNVLGKTGLSLIQINKLAEEEELKKKLKEKLKYPTPQVVWDALREQKYYVAKCRYLWANKIYKTTYHWVAQGQIPSLQVQTFFKDFIKEPRTECPAIPVAPTIANISGTWNLVGFENGKQFQGTLVITQSGNSFEAKFESDITGEKTYRGTIDDDSDFSGGGVPAVLEGAIEGNKMRGTIRATKVISFTATRVK